MDLKAIREKLGELYIQVYGNKPLEILGLPLSGSSRKYFRVVGPKATVVGTYNADKEENTAFFYLAEHLSSNGVNVPKVLTTDEYNGIYLQEDLGSVTLLDYVEAHKDDEERIFEIYCKVIKQMPLIQFKSSQYIDYSICYPCESFDKQAIHWDLNYFKYMFLKLTYVPFHEQLLENEFNTLSNFLMEAPAEYFMFRDFQSRNIMVNNEKVYFIDFQGGRKGALQYDLASLLFEAKTGLSINFRERILNYYFETFSKYSFFNAEKFLYYFPAFALIRILQAFGAYGYRGLYEKKPLFVESIAKGLVNLRWIIEQDVIKKKFPYLCHVVLSMLDLKSKFSLSQLSGGLTITITSFSYRHGYPDDWSGNGGGHVFDCRSLPNPGRIEDYRGLTGRDEPVKKYLKKEKEVAEFINQTTKIIENTIKKYMERSFTSLSVGFGCTGGQHRSVYSAEHLFKYLSMNFPINIRLVHRELKIEETHEQNNV